jgi:predicted permease
MFPGNLTAFVRRLLALLHRNRFERDLDDELAFHLAMRSSQQMPHGAFGSVLRVKEEAREAWMFTSLEGVLTDVRFAYRAWRRSPGVALVAMIALASGIAVANTTFAIVNGALMHGLPFSTPERLVHVGFKPARAEYGTASFAEYRDLQAIRSLRLAAYAPAALTIAEEGHVPERLQATYVSAQGFELLGIEAVAGRGVQAEDDQPGAVPVSLISETVWRNRYGGDAAVIGRAIRINGRPSTIVGVVPTRYTLTAARCDIWLPMMQLPELDRLDRATRSLSLMGALTERSTLNDARHEVQAIASRFKQEYPEAYKDVEPIAIPLWDRFVHPQVQQILLVLFGAGLFVLAIACANVADLLLARTVNRRHEIATRVALGASRAHVWRQLLIECLLLGTISGTAALWMSLVSVRLFESAIAATDPPVWLQFRFDRNVFFFLVGVSLVSSLGVAMLPALQATRPAADGLRHAGRSTTPSVDARRWSRVLLGVEVALTMVLLSGAGLMMRSFWSLFRTGPGVDTAALTIMRVDLAAPAYEGTGQRASLYDDLAERLHAKALTQPVSVTTSLPGGGPPPQWTFQREGDAIDPDHPVLVSMAAVGDDYFRTLNRPLLAGRSFEHFDGTPAREVAIVNERLVSMLFHTESPLGRRIRIARPGRVRSDSGWMTIVGIAPTIHQTNPLIGHGPDPVVYVPFRSQLAPDAFVLARGPETVQQVRTELATIDPDLAIFDVQSLDAFLAFFRWPQRIFGTVLLVLATIALVLAAVALYANVAYAVVQRTQEIGVRVALGAQRKQILFLMVKGTAVPLVGGLLVGGAAVASWLTRTLAIRPLCSVCPRVCVP